MSPSLAPGGESADDHIRAESFFPQYVRHPGARGFACSSTVQVNVLVLGQVLDLFLEVVGFDADRAVNPLRAPVIVAMAADVDDLNAIRFSSGQTRSNLLDLDPRHDGVLAILQELQDPIGRVNQ